MVEMIVKAENVMIGRITLSALLVMSSIGLEAKELRLTTEDSPPFNYIDPETHDITGLMTELLAEMAKRGGIEHRTELLPWRRAYGLALRKADTCVYATSVSEARRPLFKWVGPLFTSDWVFLARKGSGITLKSLNDAKPYRIGGYAGDAVAIFLKDRGFSVDEARENAHNVAKLKSDRIQLWAADSLVGHHLAKKRGADGDLEEVLTFARRDLALACNPAVADSDIARLNAALAVMRQDGAYAAILARYR